MGELFVKQAEVYSKARPRYPESLFSFLASLTPSHALAWDVGTGNGQAAIAISKHYEKVIATDVTAQQLHYAERRPNVTYALTPTTLSKDELARIVGPAGSVDLVVVAEALHWFDLDSFYENVRHVLRRPGGVIAATVYRSRPAMGDPALQKALDEFYAAIEHHWAPEVQYVEDEYRNIPFPFGPAVQEGQDEGPFEATMDANLDEFLSYLETWSAIQTAADEGHDPLGERQRNLFADAWGPPETRRRLRWPLVVLAGMVPDDARHSPAT